MTILSARSLTKAYGAATLLSDASVTLEEGDRVGLLGVNGSGKSTLLRVLAGIEPADAGVIDRKRGARFLYLPQEPALDPKASPRALALEGLAEWSSTKARHAAVTDAIDRGDRNPAVVAEQSRLAERVEALGGWERDHLAIEILHKLGVSDTERPVGTMSGGEQRRVALARILVAEPDLAILDEPTNHLDPEAIEWLEEHLAASRGAVLLVTHDRYVLDAVATRVLELDRGTLREFAGNYGDYVEQKATLLEHEARVEANRLNLLRRERAWLMRGARARTTKQKARIARAEEVIAIEAPREAAQARIEATATRMGKTVLELHGVGLDLGGKRLVEDLTLHLVQGDRVGVVGGNGAGKTSLLKLVAGEVAPTRGTVVVGKQTQIAYFDQARADLRDDWSIFDNVAEREGAERTGAGAVRLGERTLDLRSYLEGFLFEGSKQRQKVSSLSGGERARVALAKLLKTGSNLLLLDEPTNDLDIATLGALEEMLVTWPGCALIVTHDRWFLNRTATSVLGFLGEGKVVHFAGDWDAYRSARDEARAASQERARVDAPRPPAGSTRKDEPAPTAKPLTYAERLELEGLLDRVSAAEEELGRVERELSDPAVYAAGGERVRALHDARARAAGRVAELTSRWETLESRRETKR